MVTCFMFFIYIRLVLFVNFLKLLNVQILENALRYDFNEIDITVDLFIISRPIQTTTTVDIVKRMILFSCYQI